MFNWPSEFTRTTFKEVKTAKYFKTVLAVNFKIDFLNCKTAKYSTKIINVNYKFEKLQNM